jgi:hypothetical protein
MKIATKEPSCSDNAPIASTPGGPMPMHIVTSRRRRPRLLELVGREFKPRSCHVSWRTTPSNTRHILRWFFPPEVLAVFVGGLRKAGLPEE